MAIIKYGPIVADARGSIGGTVLSRNAAGAYAKQRTTPTYPATSKQQNVAALLSTIIDDWKNSLTTDQRNAWNALAAITSLPNKLGEQFTPSGLNLFVKANTMLDHINAAHITTPPVAAVAPTPQLTVNWTEAVSIFVSSIGNWDNSPAGSIWIQSFKNGPLSQNYYKGPYTDSGVIPFADFDTLPYVILGPATLIDNSRTHFRLRAVHEDGMVSAAWLGFADRGSTA